MKKKCMKNIVKKGICLVAMLCVMSSIATPVLAIEQTLIVEDEIQPRTDIKDWVYKVFDGDLYKRLYNYSTGHWEGDWIFVAHGKN